MDLFKVIKKVNNRQLIVDLPEKFDSKEVEVTVIAKDQDELTNLTQLSEESFNDWDNEADEIYNDI